MGLNLLIHFAPGARGDFLANVLLGVFKARSDNLAMMPPDYVKIHYVGLHLSLDPFPIWFLKDYDKIKNFKGIKIRIDPGIDPTNIIMIELNNLIKNKKITEFNSSHYDHIYRNAEFFLTHEYQLVLENKSCYDYWINYTDLSDINFLKKFYQEINGCEISDTLLEKYEENIRIHQQYTPDTRIKNLIKVLDFEIKNSCLNKIKYYNLMDNLDNVENFLNLESYEKD